MYKVGDIIPYYSDWNKKTPEIIEGYGKLIERIDDDDNYELIYDEMPEAKQEVYYRQRWKLEIGTRRRTISERGLTVTKVIPEYVVRSFSILKQIGIHDKKNNTTAVRNKYNFREGHIAKVKNVVTSKLNITKLDKDDMYRIYNDRSTNYEYKPILLDRKTKRFVENDKFKFDTLLNIKFKTIECKDNCADCPIDWKPKYLHQAQEIYRIMTNQELVIEPEDVKRILKYDK